MQISDVDDINDVTQKVAEDIVSKASDGLHQYYVRDLHTNNYALRQAELFKIIRMAEVRFLRPRNRTF